MPEPSSVSRVVIHPLQVPGLTHALTAPEGMTLVAPDRASLDAAVADEADGLVTYVWQDSFLDHGLRWIQAVSAGIDQFPLDRLESRGIVLTSARGAHSPAVADHAVGLLLALLRRLGPAIRRSRERVWHPEPAHETQGLTVGIVGLGSIGEAIAQRVAALGMTVIGCKRDPSRHRGVAERVVGVDGMDSIFSDSDVVVLALPHTTETEKAVGRDQLAALGAGWLVNVGRGAVVNEAALVEALRSGDLRGAALDVTAVEPLPESSPLWDLEDVIITPHMAWGSPLLSLRLAEIFGVNAKAFLGLGEWLNRETR